MLVKDYAKSVSIERDLHKRDEKTGEILEYPQTVGSYGYSRQIEIKDVERSAVEFFQRLSSLAEDDWDFSDTKATTLAERYEYYWRRLREDFFDFESAVKKLLFTLQGDFLRNAFASKEGEDNDGASDWSSKNTSPSLSKTLCAIADSKQLLLGIWGYLIDKEDYYLQRINDYEEEEDKERLGKHLEYFDGLFRKVDDISNTISTKEKEDFNERTAWREWYGLADERVNEAVRDFSTRGIFSYFEERGIELPIQHYRCCPYVEMGQGKRLFLRLIDENAGTFAFSYNYTFDHFEKVTFRGVLQELGYE